MSDAIVLITVKIGTANEVAQTIADLEGVSEVFSVAGDWDLVAVVRANEQVGLTDIVPGGIAKVEGVENTRTLMAFKTFSKQDLSTAYDIGLD